MAEAPPRRRALCVRPQLNQDAPPFLRTISDEWVHALALHCDVTTIDHDFDFRETCEVLKPDFVIYDAVHWVRPNRIAVTNADAFPEIPRAFYFNCDPHDPMRPQILEMLAAYGVDTIFCGVEHLQQMPELSRFTCFVIPLFIDTAVFRDHGVEKTIPVSIFGGHFLPAFYPWRVKLAEELPHLMPTLVYPHPGYRNGGESPFAVRDENYARILSASWFSVADTTRMAYVVRKHLEIPAAGAVLVAPEADIVKALGFVDLDNCVLGEGPALYAKLQAVAADPPRYERIRQAGHDLVHSRYTRAHWTHIVDWFECRLLCGAHETTQQAGRFGAFRNVPAHADTPSIEDLSFGETPMSTALGSATLAILAGEGVDSAAADLMTATEWADHAAEPWFLLGTIAVLGGDLDTGLALISRRSGVTIGEADGAPTYQFGPLDPCELAWLLLIAAIKGDGALCDALLERVPSSPHVAVRRAMWLLSGSPHDIDFGEAGLMAAQPGDWPSIHWLGQEDFPIWLRLTGRLLAANGRAGAADFMRIVAEAFEGVDEDAAEFREAC